MENIRFGADEIERTLAKLDQRSLDDLPFGTILLNPKGEILRYNATESNISGRKRDDVIGRNFFREVAPCTDVKGFRDRFDEGVRQGKLNALFEMVFDHKMTPTRVRVHMKMANDGNVWIFTKRL
jgi:photoactive yellow protein